jgi:hypothetical protein
MYFLPEPQGQGSFRPTLGAVHRVTVMVFQCRIISPRISLAWSRLAYRLKYIHAAIANKTIIAIQRDESLIPVFLAMNHILSPTSRQCGTVLL